MGARRGGGGAKLDARIPWKITTKFSLLRGPSYTYARPFSRVGTFFLYGVFFTILEALFTLWEAFFSLWNLFWANLQR